MCRGKDYPNVALNVSSENLDQKPLFPARLVFGVLALRVSSESTDLELIGSMTLCSACHFLSSQQ